MDNFVKLADGLDVAPALAALARQAHFWVRLNPDESRYVPPLGADNAQLLEAELPEIWRLIDTVLAIAAAEHGDTGALGHARVGLMPPGEGLPPHNDGIDGVVQRRYQLALQSEPGVVLIVGGEEKCPRSGEAWQIDASRIHSITNASASDRITILFDTWARYPAAPSADPTSLRNSAASSEERPEGT